MTVVQFQARSAAKATVAPKGSLVAALDIGSTKIGCLIAEVVPARHRTAESDDKHTLKVLGAGYQLSRGVRGGAIVNMDEAERAIRLTVDAAERMAQRTISENYVNVSGGRPQSQRYIGSVPAQGGQVMQRDMNRALDAALDQVDPGRRSIMHITPLQYHLDDASGIKDPAGLFGDNLALDLSVVTVEAPHLKNLVMAVERAHLSVAGFVIAPYAAARAVLAEDERALGVTVVDMGGSTTSFAVFHDNHLVMADVVPVGGQHITNDIARGLSTTIAHAERMKTLWGSALSSSVDEREMISVPLLGERGVDTVQQVPKSMLTGIIRPRLEETFEMLRNRLDGSGHAHFGGCRMVITGGASQLNGVQEVARQWTGRQVRLGAPAHVKGMPETAHAPAFAVCAGLLNYALKPDEHCELPKHKAKQVERAQQNYVTRVGRWIAESF
ncbi:cell division protein FtsA [Aestuariivirga sp.]|uniref:cell division protein FtsA n=1 Tax=Aestuariivirga sp. TaxID=2650926 RepID=UPI0025B8EE6E|nr:cell division protein FtsA [Aestuariivirga sp.]MCA3556405.1 cell division protein FtsA [Aestuariivirga sp.]